MNKPRKLILTDMDDCLVSWIKGFARYIQAVHNPAFDINSEPDNWEMSKWAGVDPATVWAWVEDFNSGKYWQFGALPPTRRAQEVVARLNSAGYDFVVITSASSDPAVINLRRANLHLLFGDAIVGLHCIDLKDSKAPYLAQYQPTIWIEDKVKNAELGMQFGHIPILINQLHNEGMETKATRVDNWHEIETIILERG